MSAESSNTEPSLKQKTIKGVAWTAASNFANIGIGFLFGLFLARLLSPSDYGLIAMIGVFTGIAGCFINSGFSNALVRKTDRTEVDNSTAFYFNIVVGIVCYAILFFCAPLIADFYDMPILTSIVRAVGITLITNSLCIVQQALLTAKIDFKTQSKISISSNIFSGLVAVVFAFLGYGVWALVIQGILTGIFRTTILWIVAGWRPTERFSYQSFKELFGYGSKLLASGLLDTIWVNIYPILIGKLFTPAQLGLYTRAQNFANLPSSNVNGVIQRVTFPVLSQMQDDDIRLATNYRRLLKMTAFIVFPMMMLLAGIADPLVRFLITDKWEGCIHLLQIICFSMMWYPVHSINLNLLQVKGRSDLFLRLEIIKKIIAAAILCVSYRWGVEGMCVGSIVSSLICLVINTYYTGKLINVGYFKQMGDLIPIFIKSFLAGALALLCTLPDMPHIAKLAAGSTVAVIFYIGISWIFKSPELHEVIEIINSRRGKQQS